MMSCACQITDARPFELLYWRGDTVPIVATITTAKGAAFNLNGCAPVFTVLASDEEGALPLWEKSLGSGISILDLAGGKLAIAPTLSESRALTAGRTYPSRFVLTDSAGSIQTTATGYLLAR